MSGFYWRLGEQMDVAVNRRIHAVVRAMVAHPFPGVTDLIPGYACLYVEFDARKTDEATIRAFLATHELDQGEAAQPAQLDIPVRYDGEDFAEIAWRADLSTKEVIELHSSKEYHVHALGFSPGLPFMGEVDEKLRFPRRPNPRPRVPAHTVAVANAQTNIYPIASPGGWNLLGRALVAVYDPHREKPFYIEPGDQVRFVPSEGETPPEPKPLDLLPSEPQRPVLKVLEPGLQDLVVDQGRFMVGRYGLCRGGALDARSAGIANALLGNPPRAPLIEMNFKGPVLEALSDTVLAFAGWGVIPTRGKEPLPTFCSFAVKRGDVLTFKPSREGARGYLAVGSGVESRVFMGSASVDLRGKIGQPLQGGEVLGKVSEHPARSGFSFHPYRPSHELSVRVLSGPQATPEALSALTAHAFTVDHADRMGVQLAGPAVSGGEVLSEGTPLGAIQVTPAGKPIILLHDRGSMGGYSKPAVIHPRDLPKVAQLRPGEAVRFTLRKQL